MTRIASKGLIKLPKKTRENAFEVLSSLENDEPLNNWDVIKMSTGEFRVKLGYRYRLIYLSKKVYIKVSYIGPREGAYK